MHCAGVIAVETQTVMLNIPADPGMPDSMERSIPQVWPFQPFALGSKGYQITCSGTCAPSSACSFELKPVGCCAANTLKAFTTRNMTDEFAEE